MNENGEHNFESVSTIGENQVQFRDQAFVAINILIQMVTTIVILNGMIIVDILKSLRRIYLRQSVKTRWVLVKLFVLSSRNVVDLAN